MSVLKNFGKKVDELHDTNIGWIKMMKLADYKEITDLFKKNETVTAQEKIIEITETALSLKEENLQLKERISKLEQSLQLREKVVWEKSVYYIQRGDYREGPFCQRCYEEDNKFIKLELDETNDPKLWHCSDCKNSYLVY